MSKLSFTDSKVLIVGGAGFVGSNLCHRLLEQEAVKEIWIVDNLISSDINNIPDDPRVIFVFGSITEERILEQLPRDLNYVFHLACYHGNQSSIADPLADHDNNSYTSLKLFDYIKDFNKLNKVVYAAAGCAVAEKTYDHARATTEDAPISLFHDSPYSISKIIGELYGNYYYSRYQFPIVKARFQNVYGPREILGAGRWRGTSHTVWRNVTPTFIYKSLQGDALCLDNEGLVTRDFIYVDDMARGLMKCALVGAPGESYNLATGVETTIRDLADTINRITGNSTDLILGPARDWDRSGCRFGSTIKSREKLKFQSQVTLQEGLEKTIAWTQENLSLINKCISRHDYFIHNYKDSL